MSTGNCRFSSVVWYVESKTFKHRHRLTCMHFVRIDYVIFMHCRVNLSWFFTLQGKSYWFMSVVRALQVLFYWFVSVICILYLYISVMYIVSFKLQVYVSYMQIVRFILLVFVSCMYLQVYVSYMYIVDLCQLYGHIAFI